MIELPVNYAAEQALLGAVLHSNAAFAIGASMVAAEDFADGVHQRLWQRIDDALARGETVSVLSAHQWLSTDEVLSESDRRTYASRLVSAVVTVSNVPEYARIIRLCAVRRRVIEAAQAAIAKAADVSVDVNGDELLADLDMEINRARSSHGQNESAAQLVVSAAEALTLDLPVYATGLPMLDQALCGGLLPSKLYGVVARHKAGKTMLLTTMSYHLMQAGVPHLYLCLEATPAEIMQRMIGKMMGFNSLRFLDPQWRRSQKATELLGRASLELQNSSLLFQRNHRMSLDALRSSIANAVTIHKIKGVFVDYLQLVTGAQKGQSQAAWLDEITQTFAEIAKRFDIFVVVAAQENQNENVRGGEGLLNACDMSLRLIRSEQFKHHTAWLQMMASRFTPKQDLGTDTSPAFRVDINAGPMFVEIGAPSTEPELQYGAGA